MPIITIALSEFADNGNTRTYSVNGTNGHTVQKPRLVIQRRTIPTGNKTVAETQINCVRGAADSDGVTLNYNHSLSVTAKTRSDAREDEVDQMIADFRDIVGSDEFVTAIKTQNHIL